MNNLPDRQTNYLLSLIDFTYLNHDLTQFKIFLEQAMHIDVACLCVAPENIELAYKSCPQHKIATVINFPESDHSLSQIEKELSLSQKAHEIDIVFPYKLFLSGKKKQAFTMTENILKLIPNSKIIKIIIESGIYKSKDEIIEICQFLITQPIHFIKTSTGKIENGASLDAAKIILNVIGDHNIGLKVSGGIKSLGQAYEYLSLAENHFNNGSKLSHNQFRIGASQLVNQLLHNKKSNSKSSK